ncbi:coiled-coil domain-containing protein [Micromonospora sp. DT62]|uniref:coiled-coil domain-containing protein n=1 Tax=Micromonospora sp. DT62 TaxID=3416521 RepID=UPI003CF1AC58
MIERGTGGRTSALTDWRLMDVASMWACLQDHDTTNHWKQVAGWRKICDLARMHLSRLQEYRKGLAEAWPPETNEAARAYVRELDELIDKVQRTHDAASANYTALSAATQAISATRTELKKIYEAYAVKVQEKQTYDATLADPKAAMGSRVPDRPVTDADLERLNVQARGIMYGLSGELQQARVMLRQPPPRPKPSPEADQHNPDIYGGASSAAPVIPPIIPVPLSSSTTSPVARPTTNARQISAPTTRNVGPVLGGVKPGLAPSPINPAMPGATPPGLPTASGSGPMPAMPPGVRPGRGISGLPIGQPGPSSRPVNGAIPGLPPATPPASPRPMPPGGLIGGTPGMGFGPSSGSGAQQRRVNPIGGVIGGGGAGTAPTGGAGSRPGAGRNFSAVQGIPPIGGAPGMGTARSGGMPGQSGRYDGSDKETRRWDPDHPWEVDQGVSPVVRPPDEDGPIDPGPAIGFNR